ncbi:hypothetical protein IX27_19570 [Streptomyces sp. JS01]|nr:hypothetical protein IX27_19570 [Streptomyces sp. JS01]
MGPGLAEDDEHAAGWEWQRAKYLGKGQGWVRSSGPPAMYAGDVIQPVNDERHSPGGVLAQSRRHRVRQRLLVGGKARTLVLDEARVRLGQPAE